MKIQNSILDAITGVSQDTKTKNNSEINFEELLAKEQIEKEKLENELLAKEQKLNSQNTLVQNSAIKTNINILIEQTSQAHQSSTLKQNFNDLSNILNELDNYSAQLTTNANNKTLWASLNSIDQTTQKLKASSSNPNMQNLISELEVLSSTEKTKLNRGDYL